MKRIILFFAFLAYSTQLPKAEGRDVPPLSLLKINDASANLTLVQKWQHIENVAKTIANSGVKTLLPILIDNSAKLNLSKECMKNGMHLLSGVKNLKPWAIRFLDSSAKTIDGFLVGTLSTFGVYDECLDTEVKSTRLNDKGKMLYRGQYCTIDLLPPLPAKPRYLKVNEGLHELKNFSQRDTFIGEFSKLAHFTYDIPLKIGICVPSGCTVEDIEKIAHTVGNSLFLSIKATRCEVKEENKFTPLIIAVISCYSFVGFLMLVGSLLDLYAYYKKIGFKNKFIRVLLAFSFLSNFRKFVDTSTSSKTLSCLNGVRFLSMSWIVLGHSYLTANFHLFLGLEKSRRFMKDFAFQAVLNGSFSVDTFFFIGGLLVCYGTIKLVRIQGQNFNVGLYIFHRIWRIIPVYAFAIMFMFLLDLMGSGPVWYNTIHRYIKACYNNWWTGLIFINNFYDGENACVPHSWYLSADFQLYVGALIILLPMIRWPKLGIVLGVIGITASVIYSGVVTYVNDFPFGLVYLTPDDRQFRYYMVHFYFRPFVHASPYCIGLLSGYLLATKPDLKIPPFIQVVGWSLAFICTFSVLYGQVEWYRVSEPSLGVGIMYASLSRTTWTLGVAWMIICCATGHGGIINYILSWKAFIPLGRLTFWAYLVHLPLQLVYMGNIKTHLQTDQFVLVWMYFGYLFVTYGIAFAGSMLIEAPFLTLEKILLGRENRKDNNQLSKEIFYLNGSFKPEKNEDVNGKISKADEESGEIENSCAVYNMK